MWTDRYVDNHLFITFGLKNNHLFIKTYWFESSHYWAVTKGYFITGEF